MSGKMLASDRVLLLLSLVPYLREHGPTPVEELAERFEVQPALLRRLISFLGTAGIPGETLTYQHNDLFDIDWDVFLESDVVSLTQTVAIDDTPRFTGAETAALLAGLHALEGLLSDADADTARRLAARLGAALGAPGAALAVAAEPRDERAARLLDAIEQRRSVHFSYPAEAGQEEPRYVDPYSLTERLGVWYLRGYSHERDSNRTFRVDRMAGLALGEGFTPRADEAEQERTSIHTISARVPERLLPLLQGFAPTVVADARAVLEPGEVRIEIEAWHPEAAVRLVQHAPAEIEVEAPEEARRAVREWAELALAAHENAVRSSDAPVCPGALG